MDTKLVFKDSIKDKIKAEAFRLGFSLCGFTSPETPSGYEQYEIWLSNGYNAGMAYLNSSRHRTMRQYPNELVPEVKTIISLAWPYHLQQFSQQESQNDALIAGYTTGTDYHLLLLTKTELLIEYIKNELNHEIHARSFTDSAPILERELASRAGLGWIGKNSCLISPIVGSSFLLAEVFIDYYFQPDPAFINDRCGNCHRCIDACPTGCILPNRTIDSNKCISYLTIENKGAIPEELRSFLEKWLFGCDICQIVCPWNRKVQNELSPIEPMKWTQNEVLQILSLTTEKFFSSFKESALYRSKLKGLQRNALIWLGNNAELESISILQNFLEHTKESDLISCTEWALNKINQRLR